MPCNTNLGKTSLEKDSHVFGDALHMGSHCLFCYLNLYSLV